jgi:hypothetical protein
MEVLLVIFALLLFLIFALLPSGKHKNDRRDGDIDHDLAEDDKDSNDDDGDD